MDERFRGLGFYPADILLPQGCDLKKWAVVACDQYTSQPEYWQRVERFVGTAPSALHLILPESSLDGPNVETDIMDVTNTMSRYLRDGIFRTCPSALVYVERTLASGKVRRGLVGMVDLEEYDYEPGSTSLIRATEGTVLSRIPPRVAVRKNASVELPHVMVLADDPAGTVIEPLSEDKASLETLYDFDLMEHSGHLRGWLLDRERQGRVAEALRALADPAAFNARYGTEALPVMLFAMGDGNHSLATAKACYERQKTLTPPEQWAALPARYALVELVNLHDGSLEFEPIHRVLFGVEPKVLLADLVAAYPGAREGMGRATYSGMFMPTAREPSRCPIPLPNCRWPRSRPSWTAGWERTPGASTTYTARMWSAPWPLSRGIWASSSRPWARRRSSPPSSTTESCPERPSPWERPRTSGSIWRPAGFDKQRFGKERMVMPRLTVEAPAKLNLTLDVLGRRSDGYHELRMVMQSVALADRITLETGTGGGVRVRTNLSFLPTNEKNLAAAAALQFLEDCGLDCGGLSISVEKHIPVCAGTGGGSSDAAAVLRGLNRLLGAGYSGEALARLGERVGSDVPYCVLGGTALAEGRGEVLTPLPALPRCHAVLCKPAFSISTPELFARVDGVKLRHRPDTEGMVVALEEETWEARPGGCTTSLRMCCPPGRRKRSPASKMCWYSTGLWGPT